MAKQPGPRSDIDKLAIRRDYAKGATNLTALGKKYGVQRQTIARWIKDEGWGSPKDVASEIRTEIKRQTVEAVAAEVAPSIAAELLAQQQIAEKAALAARSVLDEFLEGKIQPAARGEQTKADVLNAMMMGTHRAIDIGRLIHGRTPGQPTVTDGDVDKSVQIIFSDAETA